MKIQMGSDDLNFVWDLTPPSVTSFVAAGDIASGSPLGSDERSSSNPLVTLSATGEDTTEYTITDSATACNAATDYTSSLLLSNDSRTTDGDYKVCGLTDDANNTPAYGSVAFTVDTAAPTGLASLSI